jgi:hypothetical protein
MINSAAGVIITLLLFPIFSCRTNGLALEKVEIEFTIQDGSPLAGRKIEISRANDPLYDDIILHRTITEGLNRLEYSGSADYPKAGYNESTNTSILRFVVTIYDDTEVIFSEEIPIVIQRETRKNSSVTLHEKKEVDISNESVVLNISLTYRFGAWY